MKIADFIATVAMLLLLWCIGWLCGRVSGGDEPHSVRATVTYRLVNAQWVCAEVSGDLEAVRRAAKECQP